MSAFRGSTVPLGRTCLGYTSSVFRTSDVAEEGWSSGVLSQHLRIVAGSVSQRKFELRPQRQGFRITCSGTPGISGNITRAFHGNNKSIALFTETFAAKRQMARTTYVHVHELSLRVGSWRQIVRSPWGPDSKYFYSTANCVYFCLPEPQYGGVLLSSPVPPSFASWAILSALPLFEHMFVETDIRTSSGMYAPVLVPTGILYECWWVWSSG